MFSFRSGSTARGGGLEFCLSLPSHCFLTTPIHTHRERRPITTTPRVCRPAGIHALRTRVCVPHAHTLLYARSFAIDQQTHWFTCRSLTSDQPPRPPRHNPKHRRLLPLWRGCGVVCSQAYSGDRFVCSRDLPGCVFVKRFVFCGKECITNNKKKNSLPLQYSSFMLCPPHTHTHSATM